MSNWKALAISRRIPGWRQILPVYAVIVLLIYSWTFLWFFWRLRGWLFFLSAGDVVAIGAYALATNLLESVTVLCAVIVASLVLPQRWFHDSFVARGAAMAMSGLGYMMYIAYQFKTKDDYPSLFLRPWSLALAMVIALLVVFLLPRISVLRRAIEGLADRATIFLYVLLPLSTVALLVVLVRWVM